MTSGWNWQDQLQVDNFLDGIALGQSFSVTSGKRKKALLKFDDYLNSNNPVFKVEQAMLVLVGDRPNRVGLVQLCGMTSRKRNQRKRETLFLRTSLQALDILDRLLNPKEETQSTQAMRQAFGMVPLSVLAEMKLDEHILQRQRRQGCRIVYVYQSQQLPELELGQVLKDDEAHDLFLEWQDADDAESSDDEDQQPQEWADVYLNELSDDEKVEPTVQSDELKEDNDAQLKSGEQLYDPLGLEADDTKAQLRGIPTMMDLSSSSKPSGESVSSAEQHSVGSSTKAKEKIKLFSSKFKAKLRKATKRRDKDVDLVSEVIAEEERQATKPEPTIAQRTPSTVNRDKQGLDLTSDAFDPGRFLLAVHSDRSLTELRIGLKNLDKESDNHQKMMKTLVLDNFDDFVHCRHTIDKISKLMHQETSGLRSKPKSRTQKVEHALAAAERVSTVSFVPLLEKQRRMQRLRRAAELFSRSEELWQVPTSLMRDMNEGEWTQASIRFCKASGHLSELDATQGTLYRKVLVELEECGSKIIKHLLWCLDADETQLPCLDAIGLLLEIEAKLLDKSKLQSLLPNGDLVVQLIHRQRDRAVQRVKDSSSIEEVCLELNRFDQLWQELIADLEVSGKRESGDIAMRRQSTSFCSIEDLLLRRREAEAAGTTVWSSAAESILSLITNEKIPRNIDTMRKISNACFQFKRQDFTRALEPQIVELIPDVYADDTLDVNALPEMLGAVLVLSETTAIWSNGFPSLLFQQATVGLRTRLEAYWTGIVTRAKGEGEEEILRLVAECTQYEKQHIPTLFSSLASLCNVTTGTVHLYSDLQQQYMRLGNALLAKYVQKKSRLFKELVEQACSSFSHSASTVVKEVRPYVLELLVKVVTTVSECSEAVDSCDPASLLSGLIKQLADQFYQLVSSVSENLQAHERNQLEVEVRFIKSSLFDYCTNQAIEAFDKVVDVLSKETDDEWQQRIQTVLQEQRSKSLLLLQCFQLHGTVVQ